MDAVPVVDGGEAAVALPARAPGAVRRWLGQLLVLAGAVIGCWLLGALLGSSRASAAPARPVAPVVTVTVAGVATDVDTGRLPSAVPVVRTVVHTVRAVVPAQVRLAPVVHTVHTQVARTVSRVRATVSGTVHRAAPVPVRVLPQVREPVAHGQRAVSPAPAPARVAARVQRAQATPISLASFAERFTFGTVQLLNDSRSHSSDQGSVATPQRPRPGAELPIPAADGGSAPSSAGSGGASGLGAAEPAERSELVRPLSSARLADLTASARAAALPEPSVSPD